MLTDINGRPYAKLSELKTGDNVQVDGGFTCIPAGASREVHSGEFGLYILCAGENCTCRADLQYEPTEKHWLNDQCEDDIIIGIYPDIIVDHGFIQEQFED